MNKKETASFAFPFLGAGFAHYYEWAEIMVLFEIPPTASQISEIIDIAPKPIKPTKVDFSGRMMSACSNQLVNMWIEEAYGNDDEDEEDDDEFDKDNTEFYVSAKAATLFEKDIERWLNDIHIICPIEVVFRGEDLEAGGTEFSAWHHFSVNRIPELINRWQDGTYAFRIKGKERDYFKYLVSGAFYFGELDNRTAPPKLAQHLFPERFLFEFLEKDDTSTVLSIFSKDTKSPCEIVDNINVYVYENMIVGKKDLDKAIKLYDLALGIDTPGNCQLEIYCNALWVLQHDNTGFPVNRQLNEKFLAKCLPYASRNPAIYYNAACLYVETEEFHKAMDCVKKAKECNFYGYNDMIKDMKTGPMFSAFRKYPPFAEWVKK